VNNLDFKEFKKLALAKNFVELYQHYFRLFLIAKGYFSKNLSYQTFHEICRRFCEIIQFPSEVLEGLQVREVNLEDFSIIENHVLESMSQISENDILNAFSQLTAIIFQ
jgi:hypothetical protein